MLTGAAAAQRLADRLGLGPARAELASGSTRDPSAVAADLLAQRPSDLSIADLGPTPALFDGDGRMIQAAVQVLMAQQDVLNQWWLERLVTTPAPFVEKMTWYWHGYFPTNAGLVANPNLMAVQNRTQRRLGAGGFTDLMQAMVIDPALLVWLNGNQSKREAPNENLARELMELFTLGVNRYSEPDVKEAARALTGWQVDGQRFTATRLPAWYDDGPKTVLGEPVTDAASLVSMLVARPDTARFVVDKVWRRFVSADPPPPEVEERLVASFATRDTRALMTALAQEPAMLDPASTLVKQPVEWAVGLMRALGLPPSALGPAGYQALRGGLREMGQFLFEPRDVGGWPVGDVWLTTGAARGRYAMAWMLAGYADVGPVESAATGDRPDAAARLLGLDRWSDRTAAAIAHVADNPRAVLATAACAPEYVVSR